MGKHRHSKDPSFITSTEWKNSYGGLQQNKTNHTQVKLLPFLDCALSLTPYQTPVCTKEGVLFDYVNLMTYIQEHKKNPITGENMSVKDIIKLNMFKNEQNQYHCPITYKVFNNNSHVVAIKTSGNVYLYEAVNELNLKAKNFMDLMTGEKFGKSDILVLQDSNNAELNRLRDINNFIHLKERRNENTTSGTTNSGNSGSNVRFNAQTSRIMNEVEKKQKSEDSLLSKHMTMQANSSLNLNNSVAHFTSKNEFFEDVRDIMALNPVIDDVDIGNAQTNQQASSSLTSSTAVIATSNSSRLASPDEIRGLKWKCMRELKKKAYVQLVTNMGNINIEVHCDIAPRTSWNFLTLCEQGYYNNTIFHRLIPKFMVQGGDPTGTGTGGISAFKKEFHDEFDSRLMHDKRGILSMANSGRNTNNSQFFITFAPTPHLDMKHTVFGHVVGGLSVLDAIEQIGSKSTPIKDKDRPNQEIKIVDVSIFNSPIDLAEEKLKMRVVKNIENRLSKKKRESMSIMKDKKEDAVGTSKESNDNTDFNTNAALLKRKRAPDELDNAREEALEPRSENKQNEQKNAVSLFMATEGDRTKQDLLASQHLQKQNSNLNRNPEKKLPVEKKAKVYGNFNAF